MALEVTQSRPATVPKAGSQPRRSLGQRLRQALPLYAVLLPTLLGLLIFDYFPVLLALYRSFFEWDIGLPARWIGLDNFIEMFTDDATFIRSLKNVAIITVWGIFHATVIPLIVAELIFAVRSLRLKFAFRIGMVLPAIIPGVVIFLMWRFIYDGSIGLLNDFLAMIGLEEWQHVWLGDPNTAIWAITFSGFPYVNGVNTLITLAGLQNISKEVLESSQLDGASTLRRILYIDTPLVFGQLKLNLVRAIIGSVQVFEIVFVMTQGGPIKSSMVPGLWLYYNAFNYHRMGYASAIGVFIFLVILTMTVLSMRLLREERA
jgi:raffinose/stachyose/melibiose transport system permease protein